MVELVFQGMFGTALAGLTSDIRALHLVQTAQGPVVLSATGVGGGMLSLGLQQGQAPQVIDSLQYSGGMSAALDGGLSVLSAGAQQMAVVGLDGSQGLTGYQLQSDGTFGAAQTVGLTGLGQGSAAVVATGPSDFAYVVSGSGQLSCYRSDGQGGFTGGDVTRDTAQSYLADPVALASLDQGGSSFVLALCEAERGVTAYRVDPQTGHLDLSASLGVNDGLGILAVPVGFETVEIGGRTFVIIASSADQGQGGALSVMELTPGGALVPTDHVLDSLDTRFGQVQSLEVVQHGDWTYLLAGGGDDGLSLFALMPDGRLQHLDTIADDLVMGLQSVSALAAGVVGDALQILVASQAGAGLTRLGLSLADQGSVLSAASGVLSGTGADDMLIGGLGSNDLRGLGGDDILRDGMGVDTLRGGSGADVFVFDADGQRDVIADFQPGQDRIDLSHLPMVYDASQLQITAQSWGATVLVRGELIEIRSAGGVPLSPGQVLAAIDWTTDRPPMVTISRVEGGNGADQLTGSATADVILGYAGNDSLVAGDGSDLLDGGAGADTLLGEAGDDVVHGGRGDDLAYLGGGHDIFHDTGQDGLGGGDDRVFGGGGRDTIHGMDGDDELHGQNGDDRLVGGNGNDTIYAGAGHDLIEDNGQSGPLGADLIFAGTGWDTVTGGGGRDTIHGLDGDDLLRGGADDDLIFGGSHFDEIHGDAGDDRLVGGLGRDTVYGGAGHDLIEDNGQTGPLGADLFFGGDGNDTVTGGGGLDTIHGDAGHDLLRGGIGNDLIFGGDGNDALHGQDGHDRLDGGTGHDTVTGGTGFDTITGGGGQDILEGGNGDDLLRGGADDDVIFGGTHFDEIYGDAGNDRLVGGLGRDTVYGGAGHDLIEDNGQVGALAADLFFGGDGEDTINGGGGRDTIHGDAGDDLLRGGVGDDLLRGGIGNDRIFGGDQHDEIHGQDGHDTLNGGNGNDTIYGGNGFDLLEDNGQTGAFGADRFFGGNGNDTIRMGGGDDTATGGVGADRFVFFGAVIEDDTVTDYTVGVDALRLDDALWGGGLSEAQVVSQFANVVGGNVVFDFGSGNTITLQGVTSTVGLAADIDFI